MTTQNNPTSHSAAQTDGSADRNDGVAQPPAFQADVDDFGPDVSSNTVGDLRVALAVWHLDAHAIHAIAEDLPSSVLSDECAILFGSDGPRMESLISEVADCGENGDGDAYDAAINAARMARDGS